MGAIKGKTLATQTCPLCNNFSTKRLTTLTQHFIDIHGTSAEDVWAKMNGGRPSCACGCGGLTTWHGWGKGWGKVIIGHNGSIYAVYSAEEAAKISATRSAALTGKVGWCKGLTKDTDKRIADRGVATALGRKEAFDAGDIIAWNKGLTKDTDARVAEAATSLKQKFSTGEVVPWAKGLTKETDERVEKMAVAVSLSLQKKELRLRLDTLKRLNVDEVKQRIEASGDFEIIDGLQNYTNRASKVIVVKCLTCNEIITGSINSLWGTRCFSCSPAGSRAQEDIAKWIESKNIIIKRNDRQTIPGYELDIHCEEKRIAIEYNGLYWHSQINKSSFYHNNKTKISKKNEIRLIHVFEDEWKNKRKVVESFIIGYFDLKEKIKLAAIKQLTKEESNSFFNENHMNSHSYSFFKSFGAYDVNGNIIYAIELKKHMRSNESYELEISRFCSSIDADLKAEDKIKLFEEIISFARVNQFKKIFFASETRLGDYETETLTNMGFTKEKVNAIEWWWTDMDNRFNRFKFKADASTGRSEAEVAVDAKVVKIWGCENVVYSMIL